MKSQRGYITVALFASLNLGATAPFVFAQSPTRVPVKIEVVTESPAVTVGATAQLRVNLLDSENRPAVAKNDVAVQMQGKSPSGSTDISTVLVKAGQSSGTVEIPAKGLHRDRCDFPGGRQCDSDSRIARRRDAGSNRLD